MPDAPEIIRDVPGSCPMCGMALEPRPISSPEDQENPELKVMRFRFWISVALTAPLLLIAMSPMLLGDHAAFIPSTIRKWIEPGLAGPVVLWGGWPFFVRGWDSVQHRSLNMFTLIALGIGVAFGYSLAAILFPGGFPEAFRRPSGMRMAKRVSTSKPPPPS